MPERYAAARALMACVFAGKNRAQRNMANAATDNMLIKTYCKNAIVVKMARTEMSQNDVSLGARVRKLDDYPQAVVAYGRDVTAFIVSFHRSM